MSLRLSSLVLALALSSLLPMNTSAQQVNANVTAAAQGTSLTVAATGEASRSPDFATVSAGVVTQAAAAADAMRDNARRMSAVLAALKAAGIAERDIQTSRVGLEPQYRYEQNKAPEILGYQATNTVTVKLHDLSRLGRVLDALIAQGANQINGPSFGIEHPEAAYADARRTAVRNALAQAQTYADALGVKLRKIVSIQESGGGHMPQPMYRAMAAPPPADATPIATGETSVSVGITMVVELGN